METGGFTFGMATTFALFHNGGTQLVRKVLLAMAAIGPARVSQKSRSTQLGISSLPLPRDLFFLYCDKFAPLSHLK